ncbi:MAG: DUF481 domain-containing protein [Cyclobacteriaceae bacterium]
MKTKQALILLLSICSFSATAQLRDSDTLKLGYRITSTGNISKGNLDRTIINNSLDISHRGKITGFRSTNSYVYGKIGSRQTEDDFATANYFYLYPNGRLIPFATFWYNETLRRKISHHYLSGAGVAYVAVRDQKNNLRLSIFGVYDRLEFDGVNYEKPSFNGSSTVGSWRAGARVTGGHSLFEDKLRIRYETWFMQSLQSTDIYRYYAEINFDIPFNKRGAFRMSLRDYYENIVLVGIEPNDLTYTFGITVGNY